MLRLCECRVGHPVPSLPDAQPPPRKPENPLHSTSVVPSQGPTSHTPGDLALASGPEVQITGPSRSLGSQAIKAHVKECLAAITEVTNLARQARGFMA